MVSVRNARQARGQGPDPILPALLLSALSFGVALGDATADRRSLPGDSTIRPWSAHLRAGGILVDLGQRSAHKHIMGGAVSGWGGDLREGDLTYASVNGPRAVVVVDAFSEEVGDGTIVMAIRAGTADAGVVTLNGIEVGWFEAPRDHFELVELVFDQGIVAGPNEIAIEPEDLSVTIESGCPAFDVDFLGLVPRGAEPALWPSGPLPGIATADGLEIRRGCSLTFNAVLNRASRLVVAAFASPTAVSADLEITVRSDPGNVARRARFELGGSPREVTLPLEDLVGQAVSVTLEASGGAVGVTSTALLSMESAQPVDHLPRVRNLLLVLVDTLRADRLRVYNPHTRVRTPNLSRFARSSVVFERAMAPESWTKPSVASLLTGLHPDRHGVLRHSSALPPTAPFAAEVFDRQGFATAAFVGNGYISRQYGFDRGWDTWMTFDGARGANAARYIVDEVMRWLRDRPADQRFFAYVHTVDPHAPYAAPMAYRFMYVQRRYAGLLRPPSTAGVLREHNHGRMVLRSRDRQWIEELYDAEVTYNDFHLGRLLDALRVSGLNEDTLVVVTADHGEEFLDHARLGHGHSSFEELVHVPLLMKLPRGRGGGRSAAEVGLTDVLPTACDLLRVECPAQIDGRSLVGNLLDPAPEGAGFSFTAAHGAGLRAVRSSRFKLVCRGTTCALFDLELDPGETTDVSAGHPIALAALRDALGEHLGRERPVSSGTTSQVEHPEPIDVEMNEETRRQLVALGYLDN